MISNDEDPNQSITTAGSLSLLDKYSFNVNKDYVEIGGYLKEFCNSSYNMYVYHKNGIMETMKNREVWIFVLKDKFIISNYFKSKPSNDQNLFVVDYKNIYRVCNDESNENAMNLYLFKEFDQFIVHKIIFQNIKDNCLITHFLNKFKILQNQILFEKSLPIAVPYIYQCHFLIKKVNRRGMSQSRIIVLSNKFMYNTAGTVSGGIQIEKPKWVNTIECITEIIINEKTKNMKLYWDTKSDTKILNLNMLNYKNKKEREFIFFNDYDRNEFIFNIRRIYLELKNQYLTIKPK